MKYTDQSLLSNERVLYRAIIHWVVFVPGLALLILGVLLWGGGSTARATGAIALVFAVLSLASALITKTSTEAVLTSRRVIAKRGLVTIKSVELPYDKIESLNVQQGIFGKLLNYGTLVIGGTGGIKAVINGVEAPLDLKRHVLEAIEPQE